MSGHSKRVACVCTILADGKEHELSLLEVAAVAILHARDERAAREVEALPGNVVRFPNRPVGAS